MYPAKKLVALAMFVGLFGIGSICSSACMAQDNSANSTGTSPQTSLAPAVLPNFISPTTATVSAGAPGANESSSLTPTPVAPPPQAGHAARIGIGAKVSLLGIGIEAATPLANRINLRGGFNFFNYSRAFNNDGIHYAGKIDFKSGELHLDWYPLGGFHISPGLLFYDGNKVTANATVPAGKTFTLGGTQYASDPTGVNPVTGTGQLTFPKAAPSILFGFGNMLPRSGRHFGFNFEMGGEYQGAPTVGLNLQGTACNTATGVCANAATDAGIQSSIKAQEKKINNDLSPFKFFPQISLGFGINF